MNSQSFDYYVSRVKELESAIRWYKVWLFLQSKIARDSAFKSGGKSLYPLLVKLRKTKPKIKKAKERLFNLVK